MGLFRPKILEGNRFMRCVGFRITSPQWDLGTCFETKKLMLYHEGDHFSSQQLHFAMGCLHMMTHELYHHDESMELELDWNNLQCCQIKTFW